MTWGGAATSNAGAACSAAVCTNMFAAFSCLGCAIMTALPLFRCNHRAATMASTSLGFTVSGSESLNVSGSESVDLGLPNMD